MTERNLKASLVKVAPWVVVALVLVMVLPVISFLKNRAAQGSAPSPKVSYATPLEGGVPYETKVIARLRPGNGDREIALARLDGITVSTLEMVAPTPDETGFWIADHPTGGPDGARVRLFSPDGRVRNSFRTPAGTTIFTPGFEEDLWVIRSAGEARTETLMHYARSGKLLGSYPLLPGLLARSIMPSADGAVGVLSEEWSMDPDTLEPVYGAQIVPVLGSGGKVVDKPSEKVTNATFIGYDGLIYSLSSEAEKGVNDYPVFEVGVRDPELGEIRRFKTQGGVRPFAADADGRVYAETMRVNVPEAPGIAILGDQALKASSIAVFADSKLQSRLSVSAPPTTGGWAPAAWPSATGALYSALWDRGALSVMRSTPVSASAVPAVADERPGAADARVLVPLVEPFSGDPYLSIDDAQRDLWQLVYEGLVSWDASLTARPGLAEAVPALGEGISSDGTSITWRVATGHRWHDGKPVTGQDVVATWEYLNRPGLYGRGRPFPGFEYIRSVTASGNEVTVRLSEPFGAAPEAFFPFVLPGHIVEASTAVTNGGLHYLPIGSGRYRVARWESGGTMMLQASAGAARKPALDRLDIVFVKPEKLVDGFTGSPVPTLATWLLPKDRETLRRDQVGQIVEAETGRWVGLIFNVRDSIMSSKAARQAMMAIYPYKTALDVNGPSSPGSSTVGPFAGARQPIDPSAVRSDPDTATGAALLDRAGWLVKKSDGVRYKSGKKFQLYFSLASRTGYPHEIPSDVFDPAVNRMRSVGSLANWLTSTRGFYYSPADGGFLTSLQHMFGTGVFRMYRDPAWGSIFDPASQATWEKPWGTAVTGSDDGELLRLHAEARHSYDAEKRAELGSSISKRVTELGLARWEYPEVRYGAALGINGYQPAPYPAGEFWNAENWTTEQKR